MVAITPKQAYEGLIKIEPRYHDRLGQLAECVVFMGVTKPELLKKFYETEGGQQVLSILRDNDLEAEFRLVFEAALDHVISLMRAGQKKGGLN